jgi:hypothetical protein
MSRYLLGVLSLMSLAESGNGQGTPRDSAEAAVWRFVVGQQTADRPIVGRVPAPARWLCGPAGANRCHVDSLPAEFRPAVLDLHARSRDSSAVSDVVFALAGFASQDTVRGGDRCSGRPSMSITRVGFDASLTHAVVAYVYAAGAGAFPGCGYAGGRTYLLQRNANDEWRIVRTLSNWIT